jgi:hypothetical protein
MQNKSFEKRLDDYEFFTKFKRKIVYHCNLEIKELDEDIFDVISEFNHKASRDSELINNIPKRFRDETYQEYRKKMFKKADLAFYKRNAKKHLDALIAEQAITKEYQS